MRFVCCQQAQESDHGTCRNGDQSRMNLAVFLDRARCLYPSRPAIALGKKVLANYEQLGGKTARLASAISRFAGDTKDVRVALLMENTPAYLEILFACWHAGCVAVPINSKLHPKETAHILSESKSLMCFATATTARQLKPHVPATLKYLIDVESAEYTGMLNDKEAPPKSCDPSDPAWIFYTSGTTGKPKGAILTHENLTAMSACYFLDIDPRGPWDAILHVAPMSHGSGLYSIPFMMKAGCHVIPETKSFDADQVFALSTRWKNSVLFAAPTMVKRMVAAGRQKPVESPRLIIYGGGPMYVSDCKDAIELFGAERLVQLYGQGESPMTITCLPPRLHAGADSSTFSPELGSVGTAQSLVQIMVADENGMRVAPGEVGEVLVKGPTVMKGYLNNPDATNAAIRDGWLRTGDYGAMDQKGVLTLMDRRHDLIISGGTNIYPREVEETLIKHEKITEVAVIGRPEKEWGESVIAYVVSDDKASLNVDSLNNFCLSFMARFKRPREYRLVNSLPKNSYGKVLKTAIRQLDATLQDNLNELVDLGEINW